jgi:phage shock protein A
VADHSAAAREHRAEAVELLRLAGCDDLAERIAEHLEAAAVHAVLHRLRLRLHGRNRGTPWEELLHHLLADE